MMCPVDHHMLCLAAVFYSSYTCTHWVAVVEHCSGPLHAIPMVHVTSSYHELVQYHTVTLQRDTIVALSRTTVGEPSGRVSTM